MHLLRTDRATVLLDCGLYQGRRRESFERNRNLPMPVAPGEIDAVVLSHAHIDHSGTLPVLVKRGYGGLIHATPATRDLCAVMLRDAAAIQQADARFLARQAEKEGRRDEPVEPLYDDDDAVAAMEQFEATPYHHAVEVAPGVRLTFLDAGHVLGSAISVLDVEERGATRRIVFTGDLGRRDRPILRDPEIPQRAEVLISESTYGDRLHGSRDELDEELARVVIRTFRREGKLLIPSFALERAQEVVFALKKLRESGKIPKIPVYVDSPLTVKITEVFKLHPECYDAEARALFRSGSSPFDFEDLTYVSDVEESKAIDRDPAPSIIIAASGMCEAGRILHHLRSAVEDERNTVLIVGYQAQHTLGRRLVERRARVKIFGVERDRRADVVVLNGFSAHADQQDLLDYADQCRGKGPLAQIALVHGDPEPQRILAELLRERGHGQVTTPAPGDRLVVA